MISGNGYSSSHASPRSENSPAAHNGSHDLRILETAARPAALGITFDGQPLTAYEGETVAAALWAAGQHTLRKTQRRDEARGMFCNMGVCFDCLVEIDGVPNQRACRVTVTEGMSIRTQEATGSWDSCR